MTESLFSNKTDLIEAATDFMTDRIKSALDTRGRASLMLSGGSSPKPVYEALAQKPLAWDGVGIGLVDERWVPSGAEGSNADFIQGCFSDTPAERAFFVPMHNDRPNPASGLDAAEQALALLAKPFDLCVMGMGLDAHTASWFPRSGGLENALSPKNMAVVGAIDATGCAVAGDHPERITLTYSAIEAARDVMLLLPSAEKYAVFQNAGERDVLDAPVKALLGLGDRLHVFAMSSP